MSEAFLATLQHYHEKGLPSDLLLETVKKKAWDHFLERGLPGKKDEAFQYVPLTKLYNLALPSSPLPLAQEEILSYIYPECRKNYLVFINGAFAPELSVIPKSAVALPLADAMRSYGPLLQGRFSKTLKEESDPFTILNLAAHQKGLFFYLPPNQKLEAPIQALFLSSGGYAPARIHLFLGASSSMQWVSSIRGSGFHQTFIDVSLEEGASLEQIEVADDSSGWALHHSRASLKKDSQFKHLAMTLGQRITRHSLRLTLGGENSHALLQGLWRLKQTTQAHTHVVVEHAAPSARSLQKYKGVLSETAQSSFEGKIFVRPEAQKTEAYQLNNNLLLSEGAIANAKPNLEIFADDVKASHGATVAQIDEEHLFYLQSRGLTSEQASRLLIRGFMQEMIDQIPLTSVRQEVENRVFI
jgi:Fe-S cluster assembly protein SufD